MALASGMPIRDPQRRDEAVKPTTYSASRGGWYPKDTKPAPQQPKKS